MNKVIISVRDISFSYPDMKEYLFEKVSFSIYSGERVGLLGYNGSGKTTLLDIIKGLKLEESGKAERKRESIFYLKQEDYAVGELSVKDYLLSGKKELYKIYKGIIEIEHGGIEDSIEYAKLINDFENSGGYDFINNIKKIVSKFGFGDEDLKRSVNTLSGGERRLLKLATGFLDNSDLFLLDEPTNYLDDGGIEFLTGAINSSNSAFLIVSHDRWFLDKTVDKILEIERKRVREYIGNYSKFYNTKQNELKEKIRKKKKIESEIKHLKDIEQSYKVWSNRKEKEKIGGYDKGFIGHRAAKIMKRSIQAKERVQRRIDDLKETKPYIEKWYDFKFFDLNIPKGSCITVNRLKKSIKGKLLFKKFGFNIGWGEKVAITGPNGSGKTTLLEIILSRLKPDSGEVIWNGQVNIGYLPQKWDPIDDEKEVSKIFHKDNWQIARTLMGCLKVKGDNFYKKLGNLSEGQKRKVKLVKLIIDKPNVLVLDEPTTHLDYVTVELLEKALQDFNGTVILISHDKFLRERVSGREIKIQVGLISLKEC